MSLAGQAAFAAALHATEAGPRGLEVYRNNRRAALIDCLAATYPAVLRIVGESFFRGMAGAFIAAHPPRTAVLHEYGGTFGDFAAAYGPTAELPYLADVARIEWAWLRAYHAADAPPLTAAALAGFDDSALLNARLILHPSLALIRSDWPAATIWQMNCAAAQASPIADWQSEAVAVLRPQLDVVVEIVPQARAEFLARLMRGVPLGAAIEAAAESHRAFFPAGELAAAFALGAIVAISKETSS